jgi:hypothetical protein
VSQWATRVSNAIAIVRQMVSAFLGYGLSRTIGGCSIIVENGDYQVIPLLHSTVASSAKDDGLTRVVIMELVVCEAIIVYWHGGGGMAWPLDYVGQFGGLL